MPAHQCPFRRLPDDTVDPALDPLNAPALSAWAGEHPALAGCTTAAEIVARCLSPADRHLANATLGALLGLAPGDGLARKVAMAALAPGLASVAHRLAARWGAAPADVDQAAAVVAWELIVSGVAGGRQWPARSLLGAVEARLRWSLAVEARGQDGQVALVDQLADGAPDPFARVDARLDVARLLHTAVRSGRVSPLGAKVVWATRVAEHSVADVGDALRRTPGSIRVLRARAEHGLRTEHGDRADHRRGAGQPQPALRPQRPPGLTRQTQPRPQPRRPNAPPPPPPRPSTARPKRPAPAPTLRAVG